MVILCLSVSCTEDADCILCLLCMYIFAERKKEFREWRKKHYNEFQVMKKFRERMARDEEEEEEEEGEGSAMDTV